MTWVRIDDKVGSHPKATDAGSLYLEALGLWVAGIAHCNGHHTDGVIKKHELRALAPVDAVPTTKLLRVATLLVATKRWHDEGDHWRVHGYEDEQEEALKTNVSKRREYEKLRKRVQREAARLKKQAELEGLSQRDGPGDSVGTPFGTGPGQPPGQLPGHGTPAPTDDIAPTTASITPIRCPTTPARPGPARLKEEVDPRHVILADEIAQHASLSVLNAHRAAESVMAIVTFDMDEPSLRRAVQQAAAETDPATPADIVRRRLRKFVERCMKPVKATPDSAISTSADVDARLAKFRRGK